MKKKYIIFDFDGTLMNTNEVIIASWQATGRHFLGHEFDEETLYRSFGETIRFTVGYLMPGFDPAEVHQWFRDYQCEHADGMVSLFAGMIELIEELRARGHVLAIASSRTGISYREYEEMFDLAKYFDAVVTMEDASRHKPDPEAINVALAKLGARPEEAIMIGDTRFDIGCANNAGVDCVLALWGHSVDMEQMAELGFEPTYTINTPAELLDIV